MVATHGLTGLVWGIVLGLSIAWLLGYLLREGHLGTEVEDIVLAIPIFGALYERIFKPSTYYKVDTTLMFQSVVNGVLRTWSNRYCRPKGCVPSPNLSGNRSCGSSISGRMG